MESETDIDTQSANESENAASEGAAPDALVCDFCGEAAPNVRRVALDGEYERLRTRHQVQYACDRCSEDKERARLGERR